MHFAGAILFDHGIREQQAVLIWYRLSSMVCQRNVAGYSMSPDSPRKGCRSSSKRFPVNPTVNMSKRTEEITGITRINAPDGRIRHRPVTICVESYAEIVPAQAQRFRRRKNRKWQLSGSTANRPHAAGSGGSLVLNPAEGAGYRFGCTRTSAGIPESQARKCSATG